MSVEEIACRLACSDLLNSYGTYVDYFEYDRIVDLFTEDGTVVLPDEEVRGRDAILALLHKRPADRFTRHIVSNVLIRPLSSDRAEGQSYILLYRAQGTPADGLPLRLPEGPAACAEWKAEFRRTGEGWRIARLSIHFILLPAE